MGKKINTDKICELLGFHNSALGEASLRGYGCSGDGFRAALRRAERNGDIWEDIWHAGSTKKSMFQVQK